MKNSKQKLEILVSNFGVPNTKITLSMVNLRPKMEKSVNTE